MPPKGADHGPAIRPYTCAGGRSTSPRLVAGYGLRALFEVFAEDDAAGNTRAGTATRSKDATNTDANSDWTVKCGHDLVERVEQDPRAALDPATIFTHLEPLEDPASFADTKLYRRTADTGRPA